MIANTHANSSIRFSVVIPAYNKAESIRETIKSALYQAYDDYEVIVVNDGSTDATGTILESIANEIGGKIRVVHKNNGGVSAARNYGVKIAKNDWIAFLDADDLWSLDHLAKLNDAINAFPRAALIGASYVVRKNGKISDRAKGIVPNGYLEHYFHTAKKNTLFWSSAVAVHKETFNKVGGFDERLTIGEDLDLWFRLNLSAPSAFINHTIAIYNTDAENRAMNRKHMFSKSFFSKLQEYLAYEDSQHEFQQFIIHYYTKSLPYIIHAFDISSLELKELETSLGKRSCNFTFKFFTALPYIIKKFIANGYYTLDN